LPTFFVNVSNGLGSQLEVIGQEYVVFPGFGVTISDSSQWIRALFPLDAGEHDARLQPANDDYQPIDSDNCRIEAIVVGLVRRFKRLY
jgi:hypothetical protein